MPGILDNLTVPTTGETFEELLDCKNVTIERIISSDTPEQKEYKQEKDEWVLLLKGSATLEMNGKRVEMGEGDYIFIPRATPHKVLRTERGTVWLAVHIG